MSYVKIENKWYLDIFGDSSRFIEIKDSMHIRALEEVNKLSPKDLISKYNKLKKLNDRYREEDSSFFLEYVRTYPKREKQQIENFQDNEYNDYLELIMEKKLQDMEVNYE